MHTTPAMQYPIAKHSHCTRTTSNTTGLAARCGLRKALYARRKPLAAACHTRCRDSCSTLFVASLWHTHSLACSDIPLQHDWGHCVVAAVWTLAETAHHTLPKQPHCRQTASTDRMHAFMASYMTSPKHPYKDAAPRFQLHSCSAAVMQGMRRELACATSITFHCSNTRAHST
jgi:hypothetical protein